MTLATWDTAESWCDSEGCVPVGLSGDGGMVAGFERTPRVDQTVGEIVRDPSLKGRGHSGIDLVQRRSGDAELEAGFSRTRPEVLMLGEIVRNPSSTGRRDFAIGSRVDQHALVCRCSYG